MSYIDPVVASRIKTAWAALPFDQRRRIARFVVTMKYGPAQTDRPEPLRALRALSIANANFDVIVQMHRDSLVFGVDSSGRITGTDKYEQLDPGWAESIAEWLEHLIIGNHPFNYCPQTIQIPDKVTIAMTGDWGTGDWRDPDNPAPSTKVANQMAALKPDLTIHLGDVYYAGTSDEEKYLLVNLWPKGTLGALTLNSNHEMYSGGNAYFERALASPLFALQKGCSVFALENKNWVVVGLDSAYFSDAEGLYMDGRLDQTQKDFLYAQLSKSKKVIVLTHHNGLSDDGGTPTSLWVDVFEATGMTIMSDAPAYWYWGHSHFAAIYKADAIHARCSGHGGVPYGQASILNNPNVEWYEKRTAGDPEIPERVLNGFCFLSLDQDSISEKFIDENGGIAWGCSDIGIQH